MPKITRDQVRVPADVMPESRDEYIENFMKATRGTGRLMLFACDQKIEHLNKDFYGEGIDIADAEPQHLFEIGRQGVCGVLAGQRGLIAQYAADYPEINYLVKMNSKTNIVGGSQDDPYSPQLYDLDAVLAMREAGVNIVGIGYTIYLGSEYESTMMAEAGELIAQAHANGLLVVLWIYPRGKAVKAEKDPALIAGAAGGPVPRRRLREGEPAEARGRLFAGRGAQGRHDGVRPHGPRVRRRLDGGRRDVPHAAVRPDPHGRRRGQRHRPQHPPALAGRGRPPDEGHQRHHAGRLLRGGRPRRLQRRRGLQAVRLTRSA